MRKSIKEIFLILLTILILIVTSIGVYFRQNAEKRIAATSMFNIDGKSCYLDKKQKSSVKYVIKKTQCDAPFKLADWTYEIKGNKKNDVMIINLQGGPIPVLSGFIEDASKALPGKMGQDNIDPESLRKKPYRIKVPSEYPAELRKVFGYNYNDYDVSFVKEMWHMKHNLHVNSYKLTLQQASIESLQYMDILKKIIEEYKTKYKKVIVFGHSFGAIQVNQLLWTHGTIADGFVSSAGRLHMPEQIIKSFLNKKDQQFDVDGIPKKMTFNDNLKSFIEKHILIDKSNLMIHAAAIGELNYLEGIKYKINNPDYYKIDDNTDMFTHNNIVWITSEYDDQVGVFNEKEKAFAKKHGTLIYYSKKYIKENQDYFKKYNHDKLKNVNIDIEKFGHYFMMTQKENDKWTKILNI